MSRERLKVLRDASYVVSKACAFCVHSHFHFNDSVTCDVLEEDVSSYGNCAHFSPDQTKAKDVLGIDETLLDRREFTRNNRHKAKTRY